MAFPSMKKLFEIGDGSVRVARYSTKKAAEQMISRLKDVDHEDYFLTDKDLSRKYDIKTAMVKRIRKAANIPIKEDRIVRLVRTMDTANMFMEEILKATGNRTSYNSLYVLMKNNDIPFLRKNKIV